MHSTTLKSVLAAMLVPLTALAITSAAQAQAAHSMDSSASMPMGGMQSGAGNSAEMKQSMKTCMENMQKGHMSGDSDKDFAMMMKMHHQGAIEMAKMELMHGKSPAMKAMAKNIIAAQKKEIAKFDRWLATQK